ncbi:MAG: IS5 family transposase [Chitinophagaceae bacterium]|nr:IS5 family transposase [Chitinophagaceae bacterium]
MQAKPRKAVRKRASTPVYVSPNQLTLWGFETPFGQALTTTNRWIKQSRLLPWDKIVRHYDVQFKSEEGRPPINGRVVLGALIIKHMLYLSDRETVQQIQENVFMQYFLGYSSFTNESPFSPSLFVSIREGLSLTVINAINDIVIAHCFEKSAADGATSISTRDEPEQGDIWMTTLDTEDKFKGAPISETSIEIPRLPNAGKFMMDATVAPHNITYPTDLKLLDAARKKSEAIIDKLYNKTLHGQIKARTYRQLAQKDFLNTAKKKSKTSKAIYRANGSQLRYLRRNLQHIATMLKAYQASDVPAPLKERDNKYLQTIRLVYEQQHKMHTTRIHSIENRILNIHQPYVRPIVRGKDGKKVEFGSKLQASLVNGFTVIEKLSWDNFNEGQCLMDTVEAYRRRFGFYPAKVLADRIYCTRENRRKLKKLQIMLRSKPLGRPSRQASSNPVSPGERWSD